MAWHSQYLDQMAHNVCFGAKRHFCDKIHYFGASMRENSETTFCIKSIDHMQWGPNELVLFNFETSDRIVFVWSLFFGPKPNLSGGSSSSYETFQIVETISSSPAWVRRLTRVKASHHACIVCKQVIIIITNITIPILMEKGQKKFGLPYHPRPPHTYVLQNVWR